jgi:hypothetical protein
MASILDTFDEPITHEWLLKIGFKPRFYTPTIDVRYNFASMTDEEKLKMVNENIYYELFLAGNKKQFNIYYYPETFCLERTVVKYASAEGFELDIKDTFGHEGVISYREPYNIEAVQAGISSSIYGNKISRFPLQQYVRDTMELQDFIFSVEQSAKTNNYDDVDIDSLASQWKSYC